MRRRYAIILFLAVCLILAILLLTRISTPMISSIIFAIALIVFGILSKGFRRKDN
jgi:hypothetical protein